MNFSYGIIAVVGVLVAISISLIIAEPNDIVEPRIIEIPENKIIKIEETPIVPVPTETVIKIF